jgi:hypothetical protein
MSNCHPPTCIFIRLRFGGGGHGGNIEIQQSFAMDDLCAVRYLGVPLRAFW